MCFIIQNGDVSLFWASFFPITSKLLRSISTVDLVTLSCSAGYTVDGLLF